MPLTAPSARIRKLQRDFDGLSRPDGAGQKTILRGIKQQVNLRLKYQFSTGVGPTGAELAPTRRGRAALVSKKLPQAFEASVVDGSVAWVAKVRRDWLLAHQEGYTFPARQRAANQQYLSFNRKGKLVPERRIFNKKGEVRPGARQTFAKAHTVGKRVLPPRQMVPTAGAMPAPWDAAVRAGVAIGLQWWTTQVSRG